MQTRSSLSNNIIDFSKKFKILEKSEEKIELKEKVLLRRTWSNVKNK